MNKQTIKITHTLKEEFKDKTSFGFSVSGVMAFGVLVCVAVFVVSGVAFAQSHADMEGIEGIHIMSDGSVMLGTGETLEDASITADGMIMLGSGEMVKPVMDMRQGGTMENMDNMEEETEGNTIEQSSIESIGPEGMQGVHIMPNGRVMTGTGVWVEDARVTLEGKIRLGSGEIVEPMMDMRSGGGIRRTSSTMVVNENFDRLPLGCSEIAGEETITVIAGVENARDFPGTVFTYDKHSFDVEPCTLLTVKFVNKDNVRHQFMVHDLPRSTYTMGMFNIEVSGPGEETATFITPPDQETFFVHCGVPGHEEKGMTAQIKNAGGSGDLPGIPGITRSNDSGSESSPSTDYSVFLILGLLGVVVGLAAYWQSSIRPPRPGKS